MATPLKEPITDLGAALRAARERLGVKQPFLAKLINRDAAMISLWEVGSRKPQPDDLVLLSRHLARSPAERRTYYRDWMRLAGWASPEDYPDDDTTISRSVTGPLTEEGVIVMRAIDGIDNVDRRVRAMRALLDWLDANQ